MLNGRIVFLDILKSRRPKINCCMAAITAFCVKEHSQIFSIFFRYRIQCIALYQLHNSQALLNLCRGYFSKFDLPSSSNLSL